jgi:hypothetical protein
MIPAAAVASSLLPLVTEEAATLPSGVAEVTLGVAYFKDLRFPPFTPPGALRSQTLIELPQIGFRIGAGDWAEIEATYETLYLDEEQTSGETNRQFGSGDARLFTKVRLKREGERFPGIGLRFGTKLPNANRGSRLGTDDTDFGVDALASKTLGPLSAHVNLGLLLLGNSGPTIGQSFSAGGQDDLFNYAVALTSAPLGGAAPGAVSLRVLGELAGQTGSRFGNDRTALRFGIQMQRGAGTVYLGVSAGLVTASENLGASTGFIYRFEPGKLFGGDEE